jgi:hypothetical protein
MAQQRQTSFYGTASAASAVNSRAGELTVLARKSLVQTLGERARKAVEAPASTVALERYGDTMFALWEAIAAFSESAGSAESAAAISVAALAYRDAELVLEAHIERITREALGFVEN